MTKTNLRAYNREIESLIDQNNINEAITHCKYILKLFPKHVDTYRLLGKAYLESRHYSDAADLFLRVLSVIPDDFIAQIGMSIIREDEANLDAAIWHMERAFEAQPSNAAIQEELRRLYGRRDGVQPPKVRLTRGALVRMYARGELYPQAIAEAKVCLSEDPSRIDIEILQARMHYICNQKTEAADVCNRIISRLPFCFEANQILFDILPENAQEERKVYQQRLFAINPYCAYMTPSHASVSLVPDATVQLERLEYNGETQLEEQPEWAQAIGSDLSTEQDLALDWLPNNSRQFVQSSDQTAPVITDVTAPFTESGNTASTSPIPVMEEEKDVSLPLPNDEEDDLIPDWMKTNGWVKSESGAEPVEQMLADNEVVDDNAPAEAAEIPQWLQSIAPVNELTSTTPTVDASEDDLAWLTSAENASDKEDAVEGEIPAWLAENLKPSAIEESSGSGLSLEEKPVAEVQDAEENNVAYTGTDLEADLAWFESLSTNQTASENGTSGFETEIEAGVFEPSPAEEADLSFLQQITQTAPHEENVQVESSEEVDLPIIQQATETAPFEENVAIESEAESNPTVDNQVFPDFQENFVDTETASEVLPSEADDVVTPWQSEPIFSASEHELTQPVPSIDSPEIETEINSLSEAENEPLPDWMVSANPQNEAQVTEPQESLTALGESQADDIFYESEETPEIENNLVETQQESVDYASSQLDSTIETSPSPEKSMPPLDSNNLEGTLAHLNAFIQSGEALDEVISRLDELIYRNPVNADIWQMLGDAHFKASHLQDAIEAYTKAEE
ncbi:MAG: tetratricopeptide repeat protein [Anaerolineae bacterium]|nr:tetratricopeptide repeat protein [Anaerolineae bacterium]